MVCICMTCLPQHLPLKLCAVFKLCAVLNCFATQATCGHITAWPRAREVALRVRSRRASRFHGPQQHPRTNDDFRALLRWPRRLLVIQFRVPKPAGGVQITLATRFYSASGHTALGFKACGNATHALSTPSPNIQRQN